MKSCTFFVPVTDHREIPMKLIEFGKILKSFHCQIDSLVENVPDFQDSDNLLT